MRVFAKRLKFAPDEGPPISDLAYRLAAEQAALYVAAHPTGQSYYDPFNSLGQEAAYDNPIDDVPDVDLGLNARASSPFHFLASKINGRRSGSREQYSNGSMYGSARVGSPAFAHPRASSPYQYPRKERVGSPVHFAQQRYSSSADIARRLRREQRLQELQYLEEQQMREQELLLMANASQFLPQYQQAFYPLAYPNVNFQSYPMMQPQIYPFY